MDGISPHKAWCELTEACPQYTHKIDTGRTDEVVKCWLGHTRPPDYWWLDPDNLEIWDKKEVSHLSDSSSFRVVDCWFHGRFWDPIDNVDGQTIVGGPVRFGHVFRIEHPLYGVSYQSGDQVKTKRMMGIIH